MHPFIEIFGHSIPTYGILGVTGFAAACLFVCVRCSAFELSADDSIYIGVFAMIGAVIGAKALYLLINIPSVAADLSQYPFMEVLKKYMSGGMVFYGGLGGAFAGGAISAHYFKKRFSDFLPVLLPAFAIVAGFGRIGCFMSGCCYGMATASPLGVIYRSAVAAPVGIRLLPVQLFEAAFDFILFIFLALTGKRLRRDPLLYTVCYLLPYGIFRFILEFFRGDAVRGILLLSTSQWISIAALILSAVLLSRRKKPVPD